MTLRRIGSDKQRAELVKSLRAIDGIVVHDPSSNIFLSGGGRSDYYVDVKKGLGDPDIRKQIATIIEELVIDQTANGSLHFVAASGHGGVPLGCAVSDKIDSMLTMVRDKPKGHGLAGDFDGYVPAAGEIGMAVDDVLSTGGSLRRIDAAIERTKAKVILHAVVVDRGTPEMPYDVGYILRVEDIEPGKK